MHIMTDATIALLVTVLISLPLSIMLIGWRGGRGSGVWPLVAFLFLVIFLATWAGGAWMRPAHAEETTGAGLFWLPFVIIGLLLALMMASIIPKRKEPEQELTERERRLRQTHSLAGGIGAVVVIALTLLIVFRYFI